jgi:hypothetical protein
MNSLIQRRSSRYRGLFVVVTLVFLAPLLLTGATLVQTGVGRYQIASWGIQTGPESGRYGALVLDTTTGETKIVYEAEVLNNKKKILTSHLDRTFFYYNNEASGLSIRELKNKSASDISNKAGQ